MIQGSQGVASPFNKVGPPTASAQPIGVVASWQVSSGAFGYEYCYDTSNNNTCNTGWRSAGSATTRVFDELIAGQTYYWQVRAVAGAGPVEADGGAWWSFSVEQVGKVAPMPGAVGVPTSATLSWQPSSGSVTYDYCIDAIDNRSCDSAWTSVGTATSAVIFLNAGTTYYWQARVVTAGGPVELNAGAWWRFTTTGAFGKVGPGSDTSGHPIDVLLSWQAAPGATGYEYCLDVTDNGACDSSWVSVGTSTSAQPGGLTAGATYFWQVRALTAGGVVPANSGTWWHFTVANSPVTPPPSPNPVLPADPRSPGQRPQSSWRELPGADLLAPRARGQSILRWPDRLDLAGISSAQLRLESRFAGARSPGMVQVSLNGLTWRTLARVAATSGPSSVVVDLSPYANRAVFLRVVRDNADAAVWSVTNVVFSTTGTAGSVSPRR
jgi:hypothetical protein